jgi:hypothetical protein
MAISAMVAINRSLMPRPGSHQCVDDQECPGTQAAASRGACAEHRESASRHTTDGHNRLLELGSDGVRFRRKPKAALRRMSDAPASSERTPTCRPHDVSDRRQTFLIFQILQAHGKASAPIRMLICRPREIDLILKSEDVFH